jgi:hypothetical protein
VLQVEEYVEEGSDKLKQMAEEVRCSYPQTSKLSDTQRCTDVDQHTRILQAKEEFDRLAELSKARADLAFDSALADLNAEAAEFEAQLKASREELTASEQDFDQWENDLAVNRSEGQFFQSLYQKDKKRPAGADAAQLQARARKVVEPARQEIGSPLRFYLFLFLVAILGADVGADLLTEEPSAGPDVLYTVLAFLAGWLAINERRMME